MDYGALTAARLRSGQWLHWGIRFFLAAALTASETVDGYAPFALGCIAAAGPGAGGAAALGGGVSGWIKKLVDGNAPAASEAGSAAASSEAAASSVAGAASSEAAAALPVYDADVLTGQAHRTNGRIVGVMVNNISNSERQNARPQRGIGSADILIESKVEGGITRLCALFHDANDIPEVGPLRSGRDQFLQLLMPWQALYYHDGESIFCTQFVNVYQSVSYTHLTLPTNSRV